MHTLKEALQDAIVRAHKTIQRQKAITAGMLKERDETTQELAKYMSRANKTDYKFDVEKDSELTYNYDDLEESYRCKYIEATQIIYDAEKIEEKFDKEFCNDVINKTYIVNDINGLIKLLKSSGVDPKQFKKFLYVEKTVNKEKLESLFDLGELSLEQLNGCYDTKKSKGRWMVGKN